MTPTTSARSDQDELGLELDFEVWLTKHKLLPRVRHALSELGIDNFEVLKVLHEEGEISQAILEEHGVKRGYSVLFMRRFKEWRKASNA